MNIGAMDVETCKPVPNVLVDIWQANATGFYSGHSVAPPFVRENPTVLILPNGSMPYWPRVDEQETWLRGALPTDRNGVSVFTSIFPGYYSSRATHVHLRFHPRVDASSAEWNVCLGETRSHGSVLR